MSEGRSSAPPDRARTARTVTCVVTLAEDLFVLSCHHTTGRLLIPAAHLDLGLGGALLLDLKLRERVALVDSHVVVPDPAPVGHPLLDGALATVAGERRDRDPDHWVRHLSRRARPAVEGRLVAAGVLRVEDARILGLIPLHHRQQADDRLEHELLHQLSDAVVLGRPPSPETAALVSLALAVGLERHLFPRSDRRAVQLRMREIARGEWVGEAVRRAVLAVDAALGLTPDPAELG